MRGIALAAVAIAVASVGCAASETVTFSGSGEFAAEAGVEPNALTLHGVVASSPPPCNEAEPPNRSVLTAAGGTEECIVIGPAAVDARDVARASLTEDPLTGSLLVDLELTPQGAEKLDRLATEFLLQRGAILVTGRAVSLPTFQEARFSGQVSISGLEAEEARALAALFPGD